jgi:hypothetical protein
VRLILKNTEEGRNMRIDVHNHLLSLEIFETIESRTAYRLRRDEAGNIVIAARVGPAIPHISVEPAGTLLPH